VTAETREQVRRLKNTVMGVSNRLSLLARSAEVTGPASAGMAELAVDLARVADRLERLLSGVDA
jgi:hypothetical protein